MMKLPLHTHPSMLSNVEIVDADGCSIAFVRHPEAAAEIAAAVNQRAEMVALLRMASEAVDGNLTFFQFVEIANDISAFLANEPTP